ncbi:MAG: polyphosphate polymerase domain-containing protein [Bacteroidales bacterium]|jgi:hypothetical protein|nr:polyphosphate polymerase domain-containing protein [Bacteroidales bacterium]
MNIPINEFRTISLADTEGIRLMDRIDSKFVAATALLPRLLENMQPLFMVQTVDGVRLANYETQYLDTPTRDFYLMHHNGKLNRQKIRIRTYCDSQLSFLEVKNKSNKGRTTKIRVPVSLPRITTVDELGEGKTFLNECSIFDIHSLLPVLENSFQRMTFVNNRASERITIDINMCFHNPRTSTTHPLNGLMVLELKQDGRLQSDFRALLRELRIKPCSFSKYCMGTFLTDATIKHGRFKRKFATINKLTL